MKQLSTFLLVFIIPFLLSAQTPFSVADHSMRISGTSTMHDWHADATKLEATGTLKMEEGMLKGVQSLDVVIDVFGLKSSKGKKMDKNTYKTLDAENHPNIRFTLGTASISQGDKGSIKAEGKMTIAGETRPVTLPVTYTANGKGGVTFSGTYSLKMSDYKVEAPTMFLGALKTGDEVDIEFSLTLDTN